LPVAGDRVYITVAIGDHLASDPRPNYANVKTVGGRPTIGARSRAPRGRMGGLGRWTPRRHGQIEDMILVPAKTWHVFGPIPVIVNK
jgi:hypothetical protein